MRRILVGAAVAIVFLAGVVIAQEAKPSHVLVSANDLKWGDPPPVFEKGASFTVVSGDPGKPGFFVVAAVDLAAENVLRVPERALLPGEQGWLAYVVDGDVARRRPVRLGLRSKDGMVAVLEGEGGC